MNKKDNQQEHRNKQRCLRPKILIAITQISIIRDISRTKSGAEELNSVCNKVAFLSNGQSHFTVTSLHSLFHSYYQCTKKSIGNKNEKQITQDVFYCKQQLLKKKKSIQIATEKKKKNPSELSYFVADAMKR